MATDCLDLRDWRLLDCLATAAFCLGERDTAILCLMSQPLAHGLGSLTVGCASGSAPGTPPDFGTRLLGRCGLEPGSAPISQAGGFNADERMYWLVRSPRPLRWRLSHIDETRFSAFAGLFHTVFGQVMTPELWHWKYGAGRGCSVAAWRGDQLTAHYGGNLRRVLAFGQPLRALQVCDAMVEPRERGVMTKTGAMFQVTAAFLELYQGLAGIPLAFGFPNRRAMRLGERLGFYTEVGALVELRWPPLSRRPRLATRLAYLDPNSPADREGVERLWFAMARDLVGGIVGVRDWEYLRYRYLDHPQRHYELLWVTSRFSGRPVGLLVLRREDDAVALTDLVAPLRHLPALLVQARRLTGLWGKASLYGWITRQHARHFSTPDLLSRDIDVSIPTNTWVPQPFPPDRLRDRWWLMCGDTDFL